MNWNSLSRRERTLFIGIASLIVIGALFFGWSFVSGTFSGQQTQIETLEKKIRDAKLRERKGMKAVNELHVLRERALPEMTDVARTVYQEWLFKKVADSKLEDQAVTAGATRELGSKNLGYELSFTAKGRGTLPQIVQLLDSLQRPDYLHRIERLNIKPLPNSKLFDVTISLEAISLAKADATNAMPTPATSRLALASAAEYEAVICDRNIFGPKNNPPALRAPSSQTAYLGKEFSYTVDAKDPDELDRVTYRLDKPPTGVSIDSKSGKLRWSPKEKGKFELTVFAKDDGLPAKESTAKVVVNVTDPPKPPPEVVRPTTPPPPKFDDAKYTILAGVMEADDEREIWLLNRPKGELLKLRVGDKFKIGATEGVIESIGDEDFIFTKKDDTPYRLYKGETLDEAIEWEGN